MRELRVYVEMFPAMMLGVLIKPEPVIFNSPFTLMVLRLMVDGKELAGRPFIVLSVMDEIEADTPLMVFVVIVLVLIVLVLTAVALSLPALISRSPVLSAIPESTSAPCLASITPTPIRFPPIMTMLLKDAMPFTFIVPPPV